MHGGVIFFHHPREISRGEMSIPIFHVQLIVLPQPSHLEGCCRGLALQPDHVFLSSPFAGQKDGLFLCPELDLCACLSLALGTELLWLLERAPAQPLVPAGLLASHQALLQCFRIPDSAKRLNTSSQWLWPSWLRYRAAKKSKPTHRAW